MQRRIKHPIVYCSFFSLSSCLSGHFAIPGVQGKRQALQLTLEGQWPEAAAREEGNEPGTGSAHVVNPTHSFPQIQKDYSCSWGIL